MDKVSEEFDSFYLLGAANETKMCVCKLCDKTFSKIAKLREHLLWHQDNPMSLFEIDFVKKPELIGHHAICNDDVKVETIIEDIRKQILTNQSHKFYQIQNGNGWEMSISDSETESESDDRNSKAAHNTYKCNKCSKVFDRIHKIIYHMKHDHEPIDFEEINCGQCGKIFPCFGILNKHLRNQCANLEKEYPCNLCKIKFMWESSCIIHSNKMHLGDKVKKDSKSILKTKSFVCDICSKAFYRSEHLERHRKIHMPTERKFSCDLCKKKFNRKDNLKYGIFILIQINLTKKKFHITLQISYACSQN